MAECQRELESYTIRSAGPLLVGLHSEARAAGQMVIAPRFLRHRFGRLRLQSVSPAATVGAAIAAIVAVIIGVGQLASTAMTASSGPALHPEDVVVTSLSPAPLAA